MPPTITFAFYRAPAIPAEEERVERVLVIDFIIHFPALMDHTALL